jgi:hypothetical protein
MQLTQPHTIVLADTIRTVFPSMPLRRALAIARYYHDPARPVHRITHTHAGAEWITCLVAAHVRHRLTDYESRVNARVLGYHVPELQECARRAVQPQVNYYLNQWRELP